MQQFYFCLLLAKSDLFAVDSLSDFGLTLRIATSLLKITLVSFHELDELHFDACHHASFSS